LKLRNNFFHNVRSSAAQFIINQASGLLLFFLLSRSLLKSDFGELNWTLAVYLTIFNILPFGLDQVTVQKIASGKQGKDLPALYLLHVTCTGILLYGIIGLLYLLFPSFFSQHFLLLLLGGSKLLLFFSTPFKQIMAGKEKFNLLAGMSIVSNLAKIFLVGVLSLYGDLQIRQVAFIFIGSDALELIASVAIYRYFVKPGRGTTITFAAYRSLLKECLPQAGVAVFSSALARLDWILIGIFLTMSRLGEYSFAYKVFEMATLPLLVIAPLLVPLFSRYQSQGNLSTMHTKIYLLLKSEFVIACLTALLLNVLWIPVIDGLTQGQYGRSNSQTIFLLSLCIPLLYLNNFLWSLHFAAGRQRMILRIFVFTFMLNLLLDWLLIPRLQNSGAALAFMLSILFQTICYSLPLGKQILPGWYSMLLCAASSLAAGWMATTLFVSAWAALVVSVSAYMLLLVGAQQLRFREWRNTVARLASRKQPVGERGRI
jgi:O-antigen/teichoic acid export membrane protein